MSNKNEFIISRVLNASRELVFKMWAEAEHLNNWWGPVSLKLNVEKLEFKVGGTFLYSMTAPDGNKMFGKFIYKEIVPPSKLVFIDSFSDASEGITRHPFAPTWPAETLTTIILTEENGKTKMTMTGVPINASDEEVKTFVDGFSSMNEGWGGTFGQFENYLNQIKN